ncbi:hypothetical protein LMIV_0211 [Listeria monocytogenes FSL J1-208]|nr:hypothetical protein LMIV_0211 [Listeria monocytogenes FSL J1-208]
MGKVIGSLSIAGLAIVGTGLILSGVEELHTYMYIILVIEMGILFINVFMNYLSKLGKSEVLIGVCVLILTIFNLFTYVTYVVLTFIFY